VTGGADGPCADSGADGRAGRPITQLAEQQAKSMIFAKDRGTSRIYHE
jgi:hypothetical protein